MLINLNDPVSPMSPHFRWGEILQNNLTAKGYEGRDFNVIIDPGVMYYAVIGSIMLEEYRWELGHQISGESGHRPEIYNDVVLIDNGYAASRTSDHKYIDSFAFDSDVPATQDNITKWKNKCIKYGFSWSLGLYSWGMHLGFRVNQENRIWNG
jgi:hypothetical protein